MGSVKLFNCSEMTRRRGDSGVLTINCGEIMAARPAGISAHENCATLPPMGRRIALIEDEGAIRENYAAALRRVGYTVELYADRKSASTALRRRPLT